MCLKKVCKCSTTHLHYLFPLFSPIRPTQNIFSTDYPHISISACGPLLLTLEVGISISLKKRNHWKCTENFCYYHTNSMSQSIPFLNLLRQRMQCKVIKTTNLNICFETVMFLWYLKKVFYIQTTYVRLWMVCEGMVVIYTPFGN